MNVKKCLGDKYTMYPAASQRALCGKTARADASAVWCVNQRAAAANDFYFEKCNFLAAFPTVFSLPLLLAKEQNNS